MANKLNIGVMGDYPLIVNGAKFQATKSLRTLYVAGTGYNLKGSGNAVVVPVSSSITKFEELRGKEISVPVGSAAWGMTLKALQDAGIPSSEVTIKPESGCRRCKLLRKARSTHTLISARGRNYWNSAAPTEDL